MPTPVSAARQCLAGEAAAALDEAVAIARRRGHAQTTSLHVVSALLSLPASSSSLLRDALSRARSAAYSPRLQFKALELCFSVALDRLPSAAPSNGGGRDAQQPPVELEPPVSNSLMAAIKRSQANQRRNPDTFHLYQHYQQQQQQNSSVAGVKVELQQLVLSILDDPVVSRVFGEAGFRSYDIKFAVLHPPPSILRFPRAARCPPLFLCNFSIGADEFELSPRGYGFPFSSQPLHFDGAGENCRRIAEVLVRKQGRNPLLVGVGAGDAARDFERAVGRQNWAAFPPEVHGVKFFSIEKDVSEFAMGGRDRSWLDSRFGEIAVWLDAEECGSSPGIVLSFGDLKVLVDVVGEGKECDGLERVSYVVSEFTRVVHGHPGKLWLIGSAATYETYMNFSSQFPSVDKDWDLQLLPITSLKPGSDGLFPRPNSLMESFVPFGGLFPIASNSVAPLSRQYQSVPCHLCNDKYDQEVAALFKDFSVPVGDKYQVNLPNLLRQNELTSKNSSLDAEKAKDDGTILNVKVMDLKKKWNDICQRKHQGSQIAVSDTFGLQSVAFPHVIGLPYVADKVNSSNHISENVDEPQVQSIPGDAFPVAVTLQKILSTNRSISFPVLSEFKNGNSLPKQLVRCSSSEKLQTIGFLSHSGCLSDLGTPDELTSPSSVSSVSTDLMLGTVLAFPGKKESPKLHPHSEPVHVLPGCLTSKVDAIDGNVSAASVQYSSCLASSDSSVLGMHLPVQTASGPKIIAAGTSVCDQQNLCPSNECQAFDIRDFKTFCRSLAEKVGWQEEAIRSISQTLLRCRTRIERLHGASLRGDIWLSFLGPDKIGKRKISMALAELLFGSREKLVCVDLSTQDGLVRSNTVCSSRGISKYDLNFRGKTVVDHIAEEIRKKPWSVVLLESVDKADLLVQSSLSQAIKIGKFSDSHGREIGINNVVFVLTAGTVQGKLLFSSKENAKYSEERILAVQARQMKILVDTAPDSLGGILSISSSGTSMKESRSINVFVSKRKLNMAHDGTGQCESMGMAKRANKTSNTFLDLNLPVEEMEGNDTVCSSGESNSVSEYLDLWMEEFLDAVDETVVFRQFDFDALAEEILQEIDKSIQTAVGSKCVLEIDPKVMEQILAATWLSEGKGSLSNWLQQVLIRSFVEAQQSFRLSASSVLRLVSCEDAAMEDHLPGILLPSSILLN